MLVASWRAILIPVRVELEADERGDLPQVVEHGLAVGLGLNVSTSRAPIALVFLKVGLTVAIFSSGRLAPLRPAGLGRQLHRSGIVGLLRHVGEVQRAGVSDKPGLIEGGLVNLIGVPSAEHHQLRLVGLPTKFCPQRAQAELEPLGAEQDHLALRGVTLLGATGAIVLVMVSSEAAGELLAALTMSIS
jgi:hypothetical protein